MTDTATVETLTAEVRVLMVGNRQITLSVARQLDTVKLFEMEPFGRVRLDKDRENYVIGRSKETGTLVLAKYQPRTTAPFICELDGKITVCRGLAPLADHGDRVYNLTFRRRAIMVDYDTVNHCEFDDHWNRNNKGCEGWLTNGLDDQIQAQIDESDECNAPHEAAAALPLIVLAGLR
jgi:hypothetical protein